MKKRILIFRQFALLCLILLISTQIHAQFTMSAEVRPRTEFRNGFKTPKADGQDPAFFTEQRSRLYLDFAQTKFKMRLSLQDVRIWGETPQIFKQEDGNTNLSEAWGQYFLSPKFSIKAGRQIISYDNQRFLGGLEWAQQGRRHDALLFMYEDGAAKTKFHVGLASNNDDVVPEPAFIQSNGAGFYSVGGNYKAMQYAWMNKKFDSASLSLLALNANLQNPDTTSSNKQTLGVITSMNIGSVKIAGDFYYQTGKIGSNNVNAYLAGINATFKTKATPITIGVEHISGKDDDDTSSDIKHFSPDYGTNHAHNGFMDYFFVGPANGNVGVTDFYIKTKFALKKGALNFHIHEFLTGSKQMNADFSESLSKPMGLEFDLVYAVKLTEGVSWNLGYSQLFGTDTLTSIRPGNQKSNNWVWTMITFKPTLFKSEE